MKRKRTKTIPEDVCDTYDLENPELAELSVQELKQLFISTNIAIYEGQDVESSAIALSGTAFAAADWKKHKQIYRFTDELFEDIKEMEDARIPANALNLPFPCIYIDLKCQIDGMYGAMIDYKERNLEKNGPKANVLILCMFFQKEGSKDWDMLFSQDIVRGSFNSVVRRVANQCKRIPYETIMTILRLALYLSSSKPDVESRREKNSISVHRSPKALAEEVEDWDVGIRYTSERTNIRKDSDEAGESGNNTISVRKRPRAHIRKAHWHLYWTGEGRKIPVVHFLPPAFVNTGNGDVPVTVRNKE